MLLLITKDLKKQLEEIGQNEVNFILCNSEPDPTFSQWADILAPCGFACTIMDPKVNANSFISSRKRLGLAKETVWARLVYNYHPEVQGEILLKMSDLADKGSIVTTRNVTLNWKDVRKAHQMVETSKTLGKIVLTVD